MNSNQELQTSIKLETRVFPIAEPQSSTVALASVTFENMFTVSDIEIINGKSGIYAAMPGMPDKEGISRDFFHTITADLRNQLHAAVLGAHEQASGKGFPENMTVEDRLTLKDGFAKDVGLNARTSVLQEPKANTLAFSSVNIGGMFAVHGLRVLENERGKFTAMPSKVDHNGEFKTVFQPLGSMRRRLNTAVVSAYNKAIEGKEAPERPPAPERLPLREQIKNAEQARADAAPAPVPERDKSKKKAAPER